MTRMVLALTGLLALALALGQGSSSGASVQVKQSDTYGSYLVDASGMSLYALSADSKDTSTCSDSCAQAWPPVVVSGEPTAGSGVAGSLLGTLTRSDGSMQVTYNGLPLYTFVKDKAPGDTNGEAVQAFGGEWDLVSPYGSVIKPQPKKSSEGSSSGQGNGAGGGVAAMNGMQVNQLIGEGKKEFADDCSVCHGDSGGGTVGPKLDGNSKLADTGRILHQIIHGSAHMPSWAQLSDEQIAAVATYIRTAWSNDFGPVSPSAVGANR